MLRKYRAIGRCDAASQGKNLLHGPTFANNPFESQANFAFLPQGHALRTSTECFQALTTSIIKSHNSISLRTLVSSNLKSVVNLSNALQSPDERLCDLLQVESRYLPSQCKNAFVKLARNLA